MSDAFYKKPVAGLLLLAGAAGGPYVMFETDAGRQASQGASQVFGLSSAAGPSVGNGLTNFSQAGEGWGDANRDVLHNSLNPNAHSLAQPAIHSLQEVLRFDISPGWVLERFPRVSTVLADTQLDGLRAPLITGTTPSDIAGTLTYYFDRFKTLQRVTLHGVTGDATRFISELQSTVQLQQQPSLGGALYVLQWNGQPTSLVHVEPAAVIYADAPYSRYKILIELNQAGLEYGLSPEAQQLLDAGKAARRW